MKAQCSVCQDDWQPECREHPITIPYAPLAKRAVYLRASHQRRASDALADAIARDPRLAERYGLEREP